MIDYQDLGHRPTQSMLNQVKNNQNSSSNSNSSYSSNYSIRYPFSYPDFYSLDLSAYDKLLGTLGRNFNNSKNSLANQLNSALARFDQYRNDSNKQFSSGRATIAEDSYDRQRQNVNDLAARGLAGSGLQQLGEVQESIEKGRQVSSLADKYYDYLNELQNQEQTTRDNYNNTLVELENAYNNSVANVEMQKQNAKNQYEKELLDYMINKANAQRAYASSQMAAQRASVDDSVLNDFLAAESYARQRFDTSTPDGAEAYKNYMDSVSQAFMDTDPQAVGQFIGTDAGKYYTGLANGLGRYYNLGEDSNAVWTGTSGSWYNVPEVKTPTNPVTNPTNNLWQLFNARNNAALSRTPKVTR